MPLPHSRALRRAELDRMRRFRNRIEYGTTYFSADQVAHDLEHARAIVAALPVVGDER